MMSVNWIFVKEYFEIIFECDDKIVKIMMNWLEKYNVFILVMVVEMIDVFNICCDDSIIGVIIFIGVGDKVFFFGGD